MSQSKQQVYWQIKKESTTDHWLELVDPEGWYSAGVRWDGCVYFYRYFNAPISDKTRDDEDPNYLHICDIDDAIARLQALKQIAQQFFSGEQGEEYWGLEATDEPD